MKINHIRHLIKRTYQSYRPQPLSGDDHLMLKRRLSTELLSIYYSQPLCDQRHGLLVYERAQTIFPRDANISDDEIFLVCLFHDVAKRESRFSVTQRVIATLILEVLPDDKKELLAHSPIQFLRRLGIYANHPELSYDLLMPYVDSNFVLLATKYQDNTVHDNSMSCELRNQINLFRLADTL